MKIKCIYKKQQPYGDHQELYKLSGKQYEIKEYAEQLPTKEEYMKNLDNRDLGYYFRGYGELSEAEDGTYLYKKVRPYAG